MFHFVLSFDGACAPFLCNSGFNNLTLQFVAIIDFEIILNVYVFAWHTMVKNVISLVQYILSKVKAWSPTSNNPTFLPVRPHNYAMTVFFSFAIAGNDWTVRADCSMFVHFIYFLKVPKKFGAWVKYNKQKGIVNTLFKIFSQFVYFLQNVVKMQLWPNKTKSKPTSNW